MSDRSADDRDEGTGADHGDGDSPAEAIDRVREEMDSVRDRMEAIRDELDEFETREDAGTDADLKEVTDRLEKWTTSDDED